MKTDSVESLPDNSMPQEPQEETIDSQLIQDYARIKGKSPEEIAMAMERVVKFFVLLSEIGLEQESGT